MLTELVLERLFRSAATVIYISTWPNRSIYIQTNEIGNRILVVKSDLNS